jgi:type IV secretion system protein VirB2/type IV secretion system protein PtlA
MKKMLQKAKANKTLILMAAAGVISASPAHAAGLQKFNDWLGSIEGVLQAGGAVVIALAFSWVGYKYLFRQADIQDMTHIMAGGLFIGGAAEFASFFVG